MSRKIPVAVVTGFLGSGKTTLLGRLLDLCGQEEGRTPSRAGAMPAPNRIVLLTADAAGSLALHGRILVMADELALSASGCACCGVRGELVDALRSLFMDALQRRIEGFSHVLIETSGLADPAAIMYTLQYEPFLRDRYEYAGCIAVIDGMRGESDLSSQPEAARQAVLADALVISKVGRDEGAGCESLRASLLEINPGAPVLSAVQLPEIAALMFGARALSRPRRQPGARMDTGLWAGGGLRRASKRTVHAGIHVLAAQWPDAPPRGAFLRAIDVLQTDSELGLLRLKGQMRFAGDGRTWMVHGVHGQLYPMEVMEEGMDRAPGELIMIFRPAAGQIAADRVMSILPAGARLLSSGSNSGTQAVAMKAP